MLKKTRRESSTFQQNSLFLLLKDFGNIPQIKNLHPHIISYNALQKPDGRGNLPGLPVALEECLEAPGILPEKQAAQPKRHL